MEDWEPKILAILCNWCSYAGADLAGVSRIQYPPTIRVVRVPCSGRVDPLFIMKSLQSGFDGVLVSGCHPGDCHYLSGNYVARRRFAILKPLLEFMGIEPKFKGEPQPTSLLGNADEMARLLGPPKTSLDEGLQRIARSVMEREFPLDHPTEWEKRTGFGED